MLDIKPGKQIYLGLDLASSEFYRDGRYVLAAENLSLTSDEFIKKMAQWVKSLSDYFLRRWSQRRVIGLAGKL